MDGGRLLSPVASAFSLKNAGSPWVKEKVSGITPVELPPEQPFRLLHLRLVPVVIWPAEGVGWGEIGYLQPVEFATPDVGTEWFRDVHHCL